VVRQTENGRRKSGACWEFGLVNSMIRAIWESATKIISALEQKESRIKRLRNPERSDANKGLLEWYKQERSDNVPLSGPLLVIIFVFHNFQF